MYNARQHQFSYRSIMKPRRVDYCQFILNTQINYTQTYFADHHRDFSHDAINRYLRDDKVNSSVAWKAVRPLLKMSQNGALIFDDSVLDKRHSFKIDLVRRQYSGNEHRVIKGIGVVNCVYVNLDTQESWVVDWRVYHPKVDGKTKLDHVREMFDNAIHHKNLLFENVLMDSWYATQDLMMRIDQAGKTFYCPLKSNRKVDDSGGLDPYQAIRELSWSQTGLTCGKTIKIHGFPGAKKVKLFRVAACNGRTEHVVTNDLTQASTNATRAMCAVRWKIEQYHRASKQTLGIEQCQCRLASAQKNHIGCVVLVWNYLTRLARKAGTNIYAMKEKLLSNYMKDALINPSIRMPLV
jgi:hypothetical protein